MHGIEGRQKLVSPFNKGYNDGAGNPPNPSRLSTDYLRVKEALQPISLTQIIIENYAQTVRNQWTARDERSLKQIFPRVTTSWTAWCVGLLRTPPSTGWPPISD